MNVQGNKGSIIENFFNPFSTEKKWKNTMEEKVYKVAIAIFDMCTFGIRDYIYQQITKSKVNSSPTTTNQEQKVIKINESVLVHPITTLRPVQVAYDPKYILNSSILKIKETSSNQSKELIKDDELKSLVKQLNVKTGINSWIADATGNPPVLRLYLLHEEQNELIVRKNLLLAADIDKIMKVNFHNKVDQSNKIINVIECQIDAYEAKYALQPDEEKMNNSAIIDTLNSMQPTQLKSQWKKKDNAFYLAFITKATATDLQEIKMKIQGLFFKKWGFMNLVDVEFKETEKANQVQVLCSISLAKASILAQSKN